MKKFKKITALCLALILILGFTACENNGVPLVGTIISGNGEKILAYLEELGADKEALLTEHIDVARSIRTGYKIEEMNSDRTLISETKKETAEKQLESFPVDYRSAGNVYPGAILFANAKILHGNPDSIESSELPRSDLNIKLISGNESVGSTTVKSPDAGKVGEAIKALESKIVKPDVNKTYACALAWSDEQIEAVLGIKNASAYFGADYSAMLSGKATQLLVVFDSTYYSAEAETDSANELFEKSVDVEIIKKHGVDEKNPALLEVTSVEYGKRYVVMLNTNIGDVETVQRAWYSGISADGIANTERYIIENTRYKVFELSAKGYELVEDTDDLNKVNTILKSASETSDMSSLMPLRYRAVFVTDKGAAVGKLSADFYTVKIKEKRRTRVKIDAPSAYSIKHSDFYARPITGIDDNGIFELGDWECISSSSGRDAEFYVDSNYAEYGYAFDIVWGTDWPYANTFWAQKNGFAEDIFIELGGTVRNASIKIRVNGDQIFFDSNCDSHENIFK